MFASIAENGSWLPPSLITQVQKHLAQAMLVGGKGVLVKCWSVSILFDGAVLLVPRLQDPEMDLFRYPAKKKKKKVYVWYLSLSESVFYLCLSQRCSDIIGLAQDVPVCPSPGCALSLQPAFRLLGGILKAPYHAKTYLISPPRFPF